MVKTPPDVEAGGGKLGSSPVAAMSQDNATHGATLSIPVSLDKSPTYNLIVSNLTYKVSVFRTTLKLVAAQYIIIQEANARANQHCST